MKPKLILSLWEAPPLGSSDRPVLCGEILEQNEFFLNSNYTAKNGVRFISLACPDFGSDATLPIVFLRGAKKGFDNEVISRNFNSREELLIYKNMIEEALKELNGTNVVNNKYQRRA